jgi:hypothetical protein
MQQRKWFTITGRLDLRRSYCALITPFPEKTSIQAASKEASHDATKWTKHHAADHTKYKCCHDGVPSAAGKKRPKGNDRPIWHRSFHNPAEPGVSVHNSPVTDNRQVTMPGSQ